MAKVTITAFKKTHVEHRAFLCTHASAALEADEFALRKMRCNTPRTLTKILAEIFDDSGARIAAVTYTYTENNKIIRR